MCGTWGESEGKLQEELAEFRRGHWQCTAQDRDEKTSSNFVDQENKLQTAYKNQLAIKVVMEMKKKAEF